MNGHDIQCGRRGLLGKIRHVTAFEPINGARVQRSILLHSSLISAGVQLSALEARRNRLQSMCNGRFDVNKYSEQAIQLFNDIDKVITFRVSRRRRKMYCGHPRLCVCLCLYVCLSAAACLQYCTDPDVTWGSGRGCP